MRLQYHNMRFSFVIFFSLLLVFPYYSNGSSCSCRSFRNCYQDMLNELRDRDEASCIEDAEISSATLMVFLKALQQYCKEVIMVYETKLTAMVRNLYEVVVTIQDDDFEDGKPTIVIDGGQRAGTDSMGFAMFIISQLVACEEYDELLRRAKWVILPSTNPDGQEYARFNRPEWTKNVHSHEGSPGFGVDITRNFDAQWGSCGVAGSSFAPNYPGPHADSENETLFVKEIINKHKDNTKAYVSLRRNGHGLLYPFAYTDTKYPPLEQIQSALDDIVSKVNQRAGNIQPFVSESIYTSLHGNPGCGSSVDYAAGLGIKLAFEMKVFLHDKTEIMEHFHSLPRGYESQLRAGYWNGIRQVYEVVTNDEEYHIYSSNTSRRRSRNRNRIAD